MVNQESNNKIKVIPITNNLNKGFLEKPKNNIKVIDENYFFLQKRLLRFQPEPSLQKNIKKFIETFELCPDNESFTSKFENILSQIGKWFYEYKKDLSRFSILYSLYKLKYLSFEQMKRILNVNSKLLSEILEELKSRGLIKESPLHDPEVKELNNILKYSGESKKRKFYKLNYSNDDIKGNIDSIDSYISEEIKQDISKEQSFIKNANEDYQEYLNFQKRKQELRTEKQTSKMDKIISALAELYSSGYKKTTSSEIAKYLCYRKGLLNLRQWKGKKDRFASYSTFSWESYLKEQGYLKEVIEGDNFYLIILDKVFKPLDQKVDINKSKEDENLLSQDELKMLDNIRTAKPIK